MSMGAEDGSAKGVYSHRMTALTKSICPLRGKYWVAEPENTVNQGFSHDGDHPWASQTGTISLPRVRLTSLGQLDFDQRAWTLPGWKLAVISVKKRSRYRFRLVSISCDPNFIFSIDGHDMTIIEVDAGQRYSVVVNANQAVANYWIRANPNIGLATGFAGGINSAILRYVGAPVAEPTTNSINTNPLIENNLHPLAPAIGPVPGTPFPGGADVNLNLNIALNATSFRFSINGAIRIRLLQYPLRTQ
ncbi:putative laccase [Mycena alexandri]|uniref:Laccase n=1 Tax=Mycena alexandri TaxID=1745969 RepID=A0AAD6X632_9AGAR|nr:putative laccase [Mycena alexandri]